MMFSSRILARREDMYFLFLATNRFYEHDRVIYIPWTEAGQEIFDFIYSCDAMLHARMVGELFGLAVAEFSIANKPVITWTGGGRQEYDTCHLDLLGDRAMLYDGYDDLLRILLEFDGRLVEGTDWDRHSQKFNARDVIHRFRAVFLE